jgi:hypothetical protein
MISRVEEEEVEEEKIAQQGHSLGSTETWIIIKNTIFPRGTKISSVLRPLNRVQVNTLLHQLP